MSFTILIFIYLNLYIYEENFQKVVLSRAHLKYSWRIYQLQRSAQIISIWCLLHIWLLH